MRKLLHYFAKQSDFTKNFFTLLFGTALAQAVPVVISPVLTRLYTPSQFGEFTIYFSLIQVLCISACFRYELAILLPRLFVNAANLVALTHGLTLFFVAIISIALLLFHTFIHHALNITNPVVFYLIPPAVLFLAFYQSYFYWCNRERLYKVLSFNRLNQSLIIAVFSILFGIIGLRTSGLVIATFIGIAVTTTTLGWEVLKRFRKLKTRFSQKRMIFLFKRYQDFPKYSMLSAFIEKISGQIPSFLLIGYFSASILGFYGLAQRVAAFPVALISNSITAVFRQEAAEEMKKQGECKQLFIHTTYKLVALGFIPFLVLIFLGPWIFKWVFGLAWVQAGVFVQIIALMTYAQFVTSPLSGMFIIAQKQRLDLYIQIFLVIGSILAMTLGRYFFNNAKIAVLLYVSVYSIKYLIEFYLSYCFSLGKYAKNGIKT